jgi:hypothetical protein
VALIFDEAILGGNNHLAGHCDDHFEIPIALALAGE